MDPQRLHVAASVSNVQSQTPPPRNLTSHLFARNSPGTNEPLATFDDSGYFEWTDPSSGESFLVDSNTGNSFSGNHLSSCIYEGTKDSAKDDERKNAEPSFFDRRSLKPSLFSLELEAKKSNKIPEWLTKAMRHNPIFRPTEPEVFSTRTVDSNTQDSRPHAHTRKSWEDTYTSNLSQTSKPASDTFSASDLKNAQIIAQVDTKFIACLLRCPEGILTLIDQHAADERVRVEKYLKRLCSGFLRGEVEVLSTEKPRRVLLTRRETEILQAHGVPDLLERWGLWVELNMPTSQWSPSTQESEFFQVDVTGVPDVIASKLTTERDLGLFVKAMIATVEANEATPWPIASSEKQGENDWVKALRFCPTPLLELVNSKACRGAIMFNDPLDQHQSEDLIQRLSETVFPFQCAHGRPSIAPLTKVFESKSKPAVVDWEAFDREDG
ncbi:DNA mismatch repair protein [Ceratobasidium sp. 395]|nr:DNA mismatch repair protein [Ceratobasidium sp. 395]